MFEVIILACMFANDYSVELQCKEHKAISDSCAVTIEDKEPGVFIKEVSCLRYIPTAPPSKDGEKAA